MSKPLEIEEDRPIEPFDNVAVIGLGLIGASLAQALKKTYPDAFVFGVDTDSRACVTASEYGWIDAYGAPDSSELKDFIANKAELVILAVPVQAADFYINLLGEVGYSGLLTDTLSTKKHILQASENLPQECSYIPGHPMAGSEKNGIDGARSDLFEGANWILCPDENTQPEHFQQLHELITGMNARVISIPREEHDRAVAIVSHVPHMVAASLMRLAQNHTDENQTIMRLAAGGFKDTTRVAAGSPKLWCGIAFDNADALSAGLSEIEGNIKSLHDALVQGDRDAFTGMLEEAANARRDLPAAWIPSSEKLLEVRIPMVDRPGIIAEVATIASSAGCNIQSIDIDHISEGSAVLSLILTDEGDVGQLSFQLIEAGYSVSFSPIQPKEHVNVE